MPLHLRAHRARAYRFWAGSSRLSLPRQSPIGRSAAPPAEPLAAAACAALRGSDYHARLRPRPARLRPRPSCLLTRPTVLTFAPLGTCTVPLGPSTSSCKLTQQSQAGMAPKVQWYISRELSGVANTVRGPESHARKHPARGYGASSSATTPPP